MRKRNPRSIEFRDLRYQIDRPKFKIKFMDEPSQTSAIAISPGVSIRGDDLRFHFARSGGPGGQNVNKVNSKAELRVRPESLIGMTGAAVFRLKTAQANRMTVDGDLLI